MCIHFSKMPNVPSILSRSFVDAPLIVGQAGLLLAQTTPATAPNLVLQGASGATPQLMADSTAITCDDTQDFADSIATSLTAPYVLSQQPPPGTAYTLGSTVIVSYNALGYPVPINAGGTQPVP